MKDAHVKFRRAPETKFLTVDEEVFDRLSPYALKVYGQLRKLTSYTKENDETEITVKNLAKASGISERKTYDCLNELEYQHHIIQRHNIYHIRYGQINTFDVSQTYGHFKPSAEIKPPEIPTAPDAELVDNCGQNLSGTAPHAVPPAQYAVPTAPHAYLYKEQESSHEVLKKKQYKGPVKPPVTVFCEKEDVKNHIDRIIANRKDCPVLEDDIIDQGIYYAFEVNKDQSFDSVNKRVNIFLKKVREGQWLIPQGWRGITSQSIREQEEEEQRQKQAQYAQEGRMFREISAAVLSPTGEKTLGDILKKLKSG